MARREGEESKKEEKDGSRASIPIAAMASHLGSALEVTGKISTLEVTGKISKEETVT